MRKLFADILKWLADMLSTESQNVNVVQYPVLIGWNGIIFKRNIIERYFEGLSKYFEDVFWDTVFVDNPDVVVYLFRTYPLEKLSVSKKRLLQLVQNVAESALTKHLRDQNIFVPVDRFVAVHLHNDILKVAFARTESGFVQIEKLRKCA